MLKIMIIPLIVSLASATLTADGLVTASSYDPDSSEYNP